MAFRHQPWIILPFLFRRRGQNMQICHSLTRFFDFSLSKGVLKLIDKSRPISIFPRYTNSSFNIDLSKIYQFVGQLNSNRYGNEQYRCLDFSLSEGMLQRTKFKYSSAFLRSDGIDTHCSQHVLPSHCSVSLCYMLKMNSKRHLLVDPSSSQIHSYYQRSTP